MAIFSTKALKDLIGVTYSVVYVKSPTEKQVILEFDSILEVEIQSSSEIVEYPIETGTRVTDYKYNNPDIIRLKGIISRSSSTNSLLSIINLVDNKDGLISNAEETLQKFKQGIYHLDIQTKYKFYQNYTLKDFSRVENLNNFSLYEVEMVFKQIILTDSDVTQNLGDPSMSDTTKTGISRITNL